MGPQDRTTQGQGGDHALCLLRAKGFEPKHPRARFCSPRCRVAAWHRRPAEAARDPLGRALVLLEQAQAAVEEAKAVLRGDQKLGR